MNVFEQLCKSCGVPVPAREYKFHGTRNWRFDYAWPEHRLALEVEGGIWMSQHGKKSRHFTGAGAVKDMEKYNEAAALGWRLLRRTPDKLLTNETIQLIKKSISQ